MSGIHISCGEFSGEDKSGSAISGVVEDIVPLANAVEQRLLAPLIAWIESGDADHVVIHADSARGLLGLVVRYRTAIEAQIAPIRDPFEQMDKDRRDDPGLSDTEAKWGKGLGWRYYCVLDLEKAIRVAVDTREPVVLVGS